MPVTMVQRYSGAGNTAGVGQQDTVSLYISYPMYVEFDPQLFVQKATYTIFTFSALYLTSSSAQVTDPVTASTYNSWFKADSANLAACGFSNAAFSVTIEPTGYPGQYPGKVTVTFT